jgi:hypothetical protein
MPAASWEVRFAIVESFRVDVDRPLPKGTFADQAGEGKKGERNCPGPVLPQKSALIGSAGQWE